MCFLTGNESKLFKWQPRCVPGKWVVNGTETFTVDFWRAQSIYNGEGGVFKGPGSRMEEEVALSSPRELLPLVPGRRNRTLPTPQPCLQPPKAPRGWSVGKSRTGYRREGEGSTGGVRKARLNLNPETLVDPAPQLHSSEVAEVNSLFLILQYSQWGWGGGQSGRGKDPQKVPIK